MADYTVSATLSVGETIVFSPTSLTIDIGDRVRFTFNNGPYNETSASATQWNSGLWNDASNIVINGGGTSSYKTSTAGGSDVIFVQMSGEDFESKSTVSDSANYTININAAADTDPDPLSFGSNVTGASTSTYYTSSTDTISGIDSPTNISILGTGAQYRINGGSWISSAGSVSNGDTVQLRIFSSSSFNSSRTASLTVGPDNYNWSVTTGSADSVPDAFDLGGPVTGASTNTWYNSNTITVSGINTSSLVSVSGVNTQYRINAGSWTDLDGPVSNGSTVQIRVLSSSSTNSTVVGGLDIGGVSDSYSVTTFVDTTPNTISFSSVTGATVGSVVSSNTQTILGIDTAISVSISGGSFRVNSGSWRTSSTTVNSGDTVQVRLTASSSFSTSASCTLTYGNKTATFTVTTEASDTTPNSFDLGSTSNASPGVTYTSSSPTISGINTGVTGSVSGGTFRVNSGSYSTSNKTVNSGDTVTVQGVANSNYGGSKSVTLTVGGVSDTYVITTKSFSFSLDTLTNVGTNTYYYDTVTLPSGGSVSVTCSGGHFSTGGQSGSFVTSGTVSGGTTITVRLLSSSSYGTSTSCTLTCGGVSSTFTATTFSTTNTPGNAVTFTPSFSGTISAANANETLDITSDLTVSYQGLANGADLGSNSFVVIEETFVGVRSAKLYLERWKNGSLEKDDLFYDFDKNRYGAASYDYRDLSLQNGEVVGGNHVDGQASADLVGPIPYNGTSFSSTKFPRLNGSGGWSKFEDQTGLVLDQLYKYRLRLEFDVVVRRDRTETDPEPGAPTINTTTWYSSSNTPGTWEGITISSGTPSAISSNPVLYSSYTSELAYSPLNRDLIVTNLSGTIDSAFECYRPTISFLAPTGDADIEVYANNSLVDTLQCRVSGWNSDSGEDSSGGTIFRSGIQHTVHLDSFSSFSRGTDYDIYLRCEEPNNSAVFANSNDSLLRMKTLDTVSNFIASDGQYEVVTCTWDTEPSYYYQVRRGSSTILGDPVVGRKRLQDAYVGSTTYYCRSALYDEFYQVFVYGSYSSNAGSSVAAPTPPSQTETNCSLFLGRDGTTPKLIIGADGLSESSLKALSEEDAFFHSDSSLLYAIDKYEISNPDSTTFTLPSSLRTQLGSNAYIAVGESGVVKTALSPQYTIIRQRGANNQNAGYQLITRTLDSHWFGSKGYFESGNTTINTEQPYDKVTFYVLNLSDDLASVTVPGSGTDILLSGTTFRVGNYDFGTLMPIMSMGDQSDGAILTNNGQQALNYFDDVVPLGQDSSTVNNVAFQGTGATVQVLNTSTASGWDITPNKGAIARDASGEKVYWWNAASGRCRMKVDPTVQTKTISSSSLGDYVDLEWTGTSWNKTTTGLGYTATLAGSEILSTQAITGNHKDGALYMFNATATSIINTVPETNNNPTVICSTLPQNEKVVLYKLILVYNYGGNGAEPSNTEAYVEYDIYVQRVDNTLYYGRQVSGSALGTDGIATGGGALVAVDPPWKWGSGTGGYEADIGDITIKMRRCY